MFTGQEALSSPVSTIMLPAFQPHLPQLITPLSTRSHIYETLCSLPIFFSFTWGHLLTTHFFNSLRLPNSKYCRDPELNLPDQFSNCTSGASVSSSGSWLKSQLPSSCPKPGASSSVLETTAYGQRQLDVLKGTRFTSLALDSSPAALNSFSSHPSKSVLGSIIHHLFEAKCVVVSNLALFLTSYPIHHQRC